MISTRVMNEACLCSWFYDLIYYISSTIIWNETLSESWYHNLFQLYFHRDDTHFMFTFWQIGEFADDLVGLKASAFPPSTVPNMSTIKRTNRLVLGAPAPALTVWPGGCGCSERISTDCLGLPFDLPIRSARLSLSSSASRRCWSVDVSGVMQRRFAFSGHFRPSVPFHHDAG